MRLFEDISKAAEDTARKTESSDKEKENDTEKEKEKEEAAATKIQAAFRGHHTRKSLRVSETASERTRTDEAPSEPEKEPTKEQLEEEFSADDKGKRIYMIWNGFEARREITHLETVFHSIELCHAAKKIQATFRGHMSRKEQATAAAKSAINMVESATAKMEEKVS